MDKIIFDYKFAQKLYSIMNLNKEKSFCYADDFLKKFPIAEKDDFYEAIEVASNYVGKYIKDCSNFFSYKKGDRCPKLSIEGLFYSLNFVQNCFNKETLDEIFNQIFLLVPRSAFEKRIRARELYIEENNRMASNISRRFPNRTEAQHVIKQFNTEIINKYYGTTLEELIERKKINEVSKSKTPNYLDFISAKELIDLYYIKKQCNLLLEDNYSHLATLDNIKNFSKSMSQKYFTNNKQHPIDTPIENLRISKLKSELKQDLTLSSFQGAVEFENPKDVNIYNNFKSHLKIGALQSFDVLEK